MKEEWWWGGYYVLFVSGLTMCRTKVNSDFVSMCVNYITAKTLSANVKKNCSECGVCTFHTGQSMTYTKQSFGQRAILFQFFQSNLKK